MDTPTDYFFGTDFHASARYNYQHYLVKELFKGNLFHPRLQAELAKRKALHVIDVGTATAIWPVEASQVLPEDASVTGFDVDTSQFPLQKYMPDNVSVFKHNVFHPFPKEHLGRYDVVNCRFFIPFLSPNNIGLFLKNLLAILKPGGYLHWMDIDARLPRAVSEEKLGPAAAVSVSQLATLIKVSSTGTDYKWLGNLPDIIRETGYDYLKQTNFEVSNTMRPLWHQTFLMGGDEIIETMEKNSPDRNLVNATREMYRNIASEFENGVYLDLRFFLAIARRPSNEGN